MAPLCALTPAVRDETRCRLTANLTNLAFSMFGLALGEGDLADMAAEIEAKAATGSKGDAKAYIKALGDMAVGAVKKIAAEGGAPKTQGGDAGALLARFDALLGRLSAVESTIGVTAEEKLSARQAAVLSRLDRLEAGMGGAGELTAPARKLADQQVAVLDRIAALEASLGVSPAATPVVPPTPAGATAPDAGPPSAVQERLSAELRAKGVGSFRFVRCPADYYEKDLEYRRRCLSANHVDCLTKTIVMENTKAHKSVDGVKNPKNSKYYMVIVQYTTRLNTDKVKKFVHAMANEDAKVGKQFFNIRLAPEEVNDELSGYGHNAVSPVGFKTADMPIIMSDKITKLDFGGSDEFFMGGGEVDLKLGMSAAAFVAAYKPMVIDCTYDD